jgi:hypothetical protein
MSAARRSKQRSTMFLTCSGSRVSLRAVKPTRSPNRTVTTRRSSERGRRGWPQLGQKRAPSGTAAEHDGHATTSGYGPRRGTSPFGVRSGRPAEDRRSSGSTTTGEAATGTVRLVTAVLAPIRWLRAHPTAADTALGVMIAAFAVPGLWFVPDELDVTFREPDALAVLLVLLATLPLAIRRSRPLLCLGIVGVASVAVPVLGYPDFNSGGIGVIVGLYSVAAHASRRDSVVAAGVTAVAVAVVVLSSPIDVSLGAFVANYLVFGRPGSSATTSAPAGRTWPSWRSAPTGSSGAGSRRPEPPPPRSGPASPRSCTTWWRTT